MHHTRCAISIHLVDYSKCPTSIMSQQESSRTGARWSGLEQRKRHHPRARPARPARGTRGVRRRHHRAFAASAAATGPAGTTRRVGTVCVSPFAVRVDLTVRHAAGRCPKTRVFARQISPTFLGEIGGVLSAHPTSRSWRGFGPRSGTAAARASGGAPERVKTPPRPRSRPPRPTPSRPTRVGSGRGTASPPGDHGHAGCTPVPRRCHRRLRRTLRDHGRWRRRQKASASTTRAPAALSRRPPRSRG
jgi:hypothetical protein